MMINLKNELLGLNPINITLDLPQVGSCKYSYIVDGDKIFSEKDNELIDFIIDEEYNLLLGHGHFKLNNKKRQLIMAGMLRIKNGKIVEINNDSGHYTPSIINFKNFINKVNNNGFFGDLKVKIINWELNPV